MSCWAFLSLAGLPPLDGPPPGEEALGPLTLLGGRRRSSLYAFAAWRYLQLQRRRGGVVLLTIAVAFVLLAEAMIALTLSRNWQLSWWEWHVLMLARVRRDRPRGPERVPAQRLADGHLRRPLPRRDAGPDRPLARRRDRRGRRGRRARRPARRRARRPPARGRHRRRRRAPRRRRPASCAGSTPVPARICRRSSPSGSGPIPARPARRRGARGQRPLRRPRRLHDLQRDAGRPTEVIAMLNEFWAAVVPVDRRAPAGSSSTSPATASSRSSMPPATSRTTPRGPPAPGSRSSRPRGRCRRATRAGRPSGSGSTAAGGRRQRRRRGPPELRRDRRHDEHRGAADGGRRARPDRDRRRNAQPARRRLHRLEPRTDRREGQAAAGRCLGPPGLADAVHPESVRTGPDPRTTAGDSRALAPGRAPDPTDPARLRPPLRDGPIGHAIIPPGRRRSCAR